MRKTYSALIFSLSVLAISCTSSTAPKNRGAIVFGDSATIVTEKDPQFLSNNVDDILPQRTQPVADTLKHEPAALAKPDTQIVKVETPKAPVAEPVKLVNGKGLEAPFKSLNIFIANVPAKPGKNVNWETAKSASLTIEDVDLNNKSITVTGAVVEKVMQRTQTVVMLKSADGKLYKLALPSSSGNWQSLKGNNGKYPLAGAGNNQLKYTNNFSENDMRKAVQKLARINRMNKKEEEQLLKSVRNVRTANQAPLSVALQSVVWKISAKDPKGKSMERELRVDINR